MNQQFSFWTTIQPSLLKRTLLQGTLLAGSGAVLLAFSSVLIPKNILETWGIFLFLIAAFLMGAGLVPYRKLQKLETNPDKISLGDDGNFYYLRSDKVLFTTSFKEIEALDWVERKNIYGISLKLKNGKSKFLPYFSYRSFQEMQDIIFN